jgi:thioredoxin reductase (NADPH)
MERMRKQAQRFGAQVKFETVVDVDLDQRPFRVVSDEAAYSGDTLIVATGASARALGLDSEKELMGYGVSACATCDGFFFRDKEIVVIGGGDSAVEEAVYLTKFASKVTIIHRRDELRASKIMRDRAFANDKVEFLWDSVPEEILGSRENGVHGVRVRNVKTDAVTDFPCQGAFVAIGHTPNTSVLQGKLEMDERGYLIAEEPATRTNVEGVFACGDVIDASYRQAITAAGSGCKAALDAERWLESQD